MTVNEPAAAVPAILRAMDLIDDPFDRAPALPVLSVSELNRMARRTLESQLPLLWVEGEVSNFIRAASGHWYFSLKDAGAQVRCVIFRGRNQFAGFTPANGDHVELRALPTLYEARGEFQLAGEAIRRAGAGRLYEAFLKLKAKLEAEGLFNPENKRSLLRFPRCIGVVTSPQAAALHDVLTALARRMPGLPVILYPTPVQGAGAGAQIAAAIRSAGQRAECDVLLVCRGGGSLEDLWAFNEEAVARAIHASAVPGVSAVGHEIDFSIADFVADLRAPTPSAAAELLVPDALALERHLRQLQQRLLTLQQRQLQAQAQRLDHLLARLQAQRPQARLARDRERLLHLQRRLSGVLREQAQQRQARLDRLHARLLAQHSRTQLPLLAQRLGEHEQRLRRAITHTLERNQAALRQLRRALHAVSPLATLERGYAIVFDARGHVLRSAVGVRPGTALRVRLADGELPLRVSGD